MNYRKPLFLSILSFSFLFINSCKKNDNSNIIPANIKCINVSPDAPEISFMDNNNSLTENVPFDAASEYIPVAPVTSKLGIAGNATPDILNTVFTTLNPGTYFSLFAIDSFSKISMAMVTDNFVTPPSDSSLIRFFHFSPNASYINAILENPLDTFYLGTHLFNDQNTYSTYMAFKEIPAGEYNLLMQTADSLSISTPFIFSGGKVYTLYAKGFYQGTGNTALSASMIVHNE